MAYLTTGVHSPEEERFRKLYAFVYTLGYSRASYLEFTTSCDMEHFLSSHLHAFEALGITETILYDNLKTGILGRARDGTPILPPRFGDFALFYGFSPRYCRPYRAKTKGKVERGVRYVRQNFWVRVQAEVAAKTLGLSGLNLRAREWAEGVANRRVHGTHGEIVFTRYLAEAPFLGSLGSRPRFDTDYHAIRRVGRDGRLSYKGSLYQVSLEHAFSEVEVVESLERAVTIRALRGSGRADDQRMGGQKDGPKGREVIHAELVEPGKRPPRQVTHEPMAEGQKAQSREVKSLGNSLSELLRAIDADVLGVLDQPFAQSASVAQSASSAPRVETRDLAVYEEVARAACAS